MRNYYHINFFLLNLDNLFLARLRRTGSAATKAIILLTTEGTEKHRIL
jgi:hypothetical protein